MSGAYRVQLVPGQHEPCGEGAMRHLGVPSAFTTGRPFTSKDVQFNIERYADPANGSQLQGTAGAVTGFDTSKPNEITLTLEHPLSNIFDMLSLMPFLVLMVLLYLVGREKLLAPKRRT